MVFTATTDLAVRGSLGGAVAEIFSPLFERAILELWNNKYAGRYKSDDATIDIFVNLTTRATQITLFQIGKINVLESLYLFNGGTEVNATLISYLWPGIDHSTFRCVQFTKNFI